MTVGRLVQESPEYAKLRDELQAAEVMLRDQRERVAELRRRLPRDTTIDDAELVEIRDGARATVRLSELFASLGRRTPASRLGTDRYGIPSSWSSGIPGARLQGRQS